MAFRGTTPATSNQTSKPATSKSYDGCVRRTLISLAVAAAAVAGAVLLLRRPAKNRNWAEDQVLLARAEIAPPLITIRGIRNFAYDAEDRFKPGYYDKTFDLRALDSAWFLVEPFGKGGAAHTFVSFGFADRDFVSISVEIRKEKGESFSPLKGLMREYELMYVVGDERDLVKLRTNFRKDQVHLYRIRTTPERIQKMFVSMLRRANQLSEHPEFYNTLTNTCTTNLVRHVNEITPRRVRYGLAVMLPANSDQLAYELGLIDTSAPFAEVRRRANINELAARYADDPEFSRRIRGLP